MKDVISTLQSFFKDPEKDINSELFLALYELSKSPQNREIFFKHGIVDALEETLRLNANSESEFVVWKLIEMFSIDKGSINLVRPRIVSRMIFWLQRFSSASLEDLDVICSISNNIFDEKPFLLVESLSLVGSALRIAKSSNNDSVHSKIALKQLAKLAFQATFFAEQTIDLSERDDQVWGIMTDVIGISLVCDDVIPELEELINKFPENKSAKSRSGFYFFLAFANFLFTQAKNSILVSGGDFTIRKLDFSMKNCRSICLIIASLFHQEYIHPSIAEALNQNNSMLPYLIHYFLVIRQMKIARMLSLFLAVITLKNLHSISPQSIDLMFFYLLNNKFSSSTPDMQFVLICMAKVVFCHPSTSAEFSLVNRIITENFEVGENETKSQISFLRLLSKNFNFVVFEKIFFHKIFTVEEKSQRPLYCSYCRRAKQSSFNILFHLSELSSSKPLAEFRSEFDEPLIDLLIQTCASDVQKVLSNKQFLFQTMFSLQVTLRSRILLMHQVAQITAENQKISSVLAACNTFLPCMDLLASFFASFNQSDFFKIFQNFKLNEERKEYKDCVFIDRRDLFEYRDVLVNQSIVNKITDSQSLEGEDFVEKAHLAAHVLEILRSTIESRTKILRSFFSSAQFDLASFFIEGLKVCCMNSILPAEESDPTKIERSNSMKFLGVR